VQVHTGAVIAMMELNYKSANGYHQSTGNATVAAYRWSALHVP
jgi:hypothetical protein